MSKVELTQKSPKQYLAIDLKSFFASVECVERGLDPLGTNLLVADYSRSSKTICLAVTPSLKSYGISSRPRLFEVEAKVCQINSNRRKNHQQRNSRPAKQTKCTLADNLTTNHVSNSRSSKPISHSYLKSAPYLADNQVIGENLAKTKKLQAKTPNLKSLSSHCNQAKDDSFLLEGDLIYPKVAQRNLQYSYLAKALAEDPSLLLSFIIAPPRMAYYVEYSRRIWEIYLEFFSPLHLYAYSIDEVFIDITSYLRTYSCTSCELAEKVLLEVLERTGITATAGIGTNLYLAKVAMDIMAKKMEPGPNGTRVAILDEMSYRRKLWQHRPLQDFWRIGKGYERKLEANAMYTLGDVARKSLQDPRLLYRLFGVNAELLIDHAWGIEPVRMQDIHNYQSKTKSINNSQVLFRPYSIEEATVIVKEIAEELSLRLINSDHLTSQLTISLSYEPVAKRSLSKDKSELNLDKGYSLDPYGRITPAKTRGTINFSPTNSYTKLSTNAVKLYEKVVKKAEKVRKISLTCHKLQPKTEQNSNLPSPLASLPKSKNKPQQLALFETNTAAKHTLHHLLNTPIYKPLGKPLPNPPSLSKNETTPAQISVESATASKQEQLQASREEKLQQTISAIKRRFGKNSLLRGTSLESGSTVRQRNQQIGGHQAGSVPPPLSQGRN